MNGLLVLAHVLLPASVAVAASVGAWRCARLLRYASDPRLAKLVWFYGLFAASMVMMTVWTGEVAPVASDAFASMHAADGNLSPDALQAAFAAAERVDVFLLLHHVSMIASLSVAVFAFSHRRPAPAVAAAAGLALLSPFVPVALAAEAALTLYLAVRAILNHKERRTPGALQVTAGFFLFFLGHLSYFVLHHPGAARTPLGDVVSLVGIVLLVQLLPRPTA